VVDANALVQHRLVGDAVASGGYVVLVADLDMKFLAVSDGACALLGYTREELVQLTVPDIVVERREAESLYSKFVREGLQRGEITLRRKQGEVVKAVYEASETVVAGMRYYVSVLIPN
jgi:PAS domain S-box-containing protein